MIHESEKNPQIQIIDFEYGGYNYTSFDIANYFDEFAWGSLDSEPDYSLYPSTLHRKHFLKSYLTSRGNNCNVEVLELLMEEVDSFALIIHIYWCLWGMNQAKTQGCSKFDYLLYAYRRFQQFERQK
jgi:thiamine kinase-like enzyme